MNKINYKSDAQILHQKAVEACSDKPNLDLILMDIRMPDMEGITAAQQIRQFNKGKAFAASCNNYISKTIDLPG